MLSPYLRWEAVGGGGGGTTVRMTTRLGPAGSVERWAGPCRDRPCPIHTASPTTARRSKCWQTSRPSCDINGFKSSKVIVLGRGCMK